VGQNDAKHRSNVARINGRWDFLAVIRVLQRRTTRRHN
jgi:hypothetical protein